MEIIRVLKRDIRSQFNQSRNLGEGPWMRCKRAFWASIFILKGFRAGFRCMRNEVLGERIIYEGRRGWINNMAGSGSPAVVCDDGFHCHSADRSKMKTVGGIQKYAHRFSVGFGFYMGSWMGIDVNKRLYPYARTSRV